MNVWLAFGETHRHTKTLDDSIKRPVGDACAPLGSHVFVRSNGGAMLIKANGQKEPLRMIQLGSWELEITQITLIRHQSVNFTSLYLKKQRWYLTIIK